MKSTRLTLSTVTAAALCLLASVAAQAGVVRITASGNFSDLDIDGTPPVVPAGFAASDTWDFSFDYDTDLLAFDDPTGAFYFNALSNAVLRIGSYTFTPAAVGPTPFGPQVSYAFTTNDVPGPGCGAAATEVCDFLVMQSGFGGAAGFPDPFQARLQFIYGGAGPGPLDGSAIYLPETAVAANSVLAGFQFQQFLLSSVPPPNSGPGDLLGAARIGNWSATVPEPGSLGLLAAGLAGLFRRRQRQLAR